MKQSGRVMGEERAGWEEVGGALEAWNSFV